MTNDQTVTQADRDAAADLHRFCNGQLTGAEELMRAGKYDDDDRVQAFARHRTAHSGEGRENDKPPSHWAANDKCDRHPQSAEEWDWHADSPSEDSCERSIKRLNFAVDRGDPHAPNQMALVLRVDLSRVLGRLVHHTAHRQLLMQKQAGEGRSNDDVLRCDDCGCPNPVWFAPSDVWNLVVGGPEATDDPGGVLCPICFIAKAETAGIRPKGWRMEPESRSNVAGEDGAYAFAARIAKEVVPDDADGYAIEGEWKAAWFLARDAALAAYEALSAPQGEVERLHDLLRESLYHLRLDDGAKAYHEKVMLVLRAALAQPEAGGE